MRIFVKASEKTIPLELGESETVKNLRERLEQGALKDSAKNKRMRLIYMGKLLEDSSLVSAKVAPDGAVHCFLSDVTDASLHPQEQSSSTTTNEDDVQLIDLAMQIGVAQVLEENRRSSRSRRRNRGTATPRDFDAADPNPMSTFLVSFAIGFVFGAFTLLFFQRLSKRQMMGLMLGISVNCILAILEHNASSAVDQSSSTHMLDGQQIVQVERLDRFGNVIVSNSPALRGASLP